MNKILTYMLTLTCLWASQCFAQTWLPVGTGIGCHNSEQVRTINISSDNTNLIIGGMIIQDGSCDTMRAALTYDGIQYQQIAQPIIGTESTLSFEYNGNIYASGYFVPQEGSYPIDLNVKSVSGIWDTVPNGYSIGGYDHYIRDGVVYISGWLNYCGDEPCSLVCSFDGTQVLPYYTGREVSGFGYAVQVFQDTVFVAGNYTAPSGLHTQGYSNCAKIVNGQLERLGQGFPNAGVFYDMEEHEGKLFLAGTSPAFGITGWHRIYYYENGQLHTLPTEPDYRVTAIKSYNGGLYVAGDFDNIGNMPCHRIARWDGHEWTCLSDDMFYYQNGLMCTQDCIRDIEIWNDTLYIGGRFYRIGNTPLKRIAKLDMSLSEAFPVSITEQQRQELKLNVYPNPTKHELNITLPTGANAKDIIAIYDMHGRLIKEQLAGKHGGTTAIDVSGLSRGMYVLKYTGKKIVLVEQFVKE